MEVFVFIALTFSLVGWKLWKREQSKAVAYIVVALGLVIMSILPGRIDGILAFATWTLVSYAILNFPYAATLYLVSAFCYILELFCYILELPEAFLTPIQIGSNLCGLLGLVAIWNGSSRWEYSLKRNTSGGFPLSLGIGVSYRLKGNNRTVETLQEAIQ